ncbi:MAG: hypothetical protein IT283_03635 [Bacteroidetes bacterium]|nr:hypothetical protein [Bacteroidota bacterium]
MKNLMMAIFAVAAIGLASCSNSDAPLSSTATVGDEVSSIVVSTTPPFDWYDAVTPYDAVACVTDDTPNSASAANFRNFPTHKKNLSVLIRCLQLTDDQKTQVGDFLKAYRDCMKTTGSAFFDAIKGIREQHRTAVKEIRDAVKAGTMTKDEARTQLRELEKTLRASLEDARAEMMTAAKACETTLLDNIKSVLTAEQATKLEEWIKTGKVPCDDKHGGRTRP